MAKTKPPKVDPGRASGPTAASEQRSLTADNIGDSIAGRLRAHRTGLELTVRALAERSGISASMVSDAERGLKTPSIAVLLSLSEALGISLSQLLEPEASPGPVLMLKAGDHRVLVDASGVRREHLGPPVSGSRLEFVRFVLPRGGNTGRLAAHQDGAMEHAHVDRGTIDISVGREKVRAAQGDSVVFPADQVHGYANVGRSEASVYVVVEPGHSGAGQASARRHRKL
jgi:XRE family transcriptional regulator, regulator of sulfur utilization